MITKPIIHEGGEQVYGSADLVNILARIVDSERNFNGSGRLLPKKSTTLGQKWKR